MDDCLARMPLKKAMIDKYQILSVLEVTDFDISYRVKDIKTGEKLKLREFFPKYCQRDKNSFNILSLEPEKQATFIDGLKHFRDENIILAKLNHPSIMQIMGLIEKNKTIYVVEPLVIGESLDNYIAKLGRNLRYEEVRNIFLPILSGLQALHELGLLHLNVVSSNIILTSEKKSLLFGFKGTCCNQRVANLVCPILPPNYEGLLLKPETDVYALSACIYFAISGVAIPTVLQRKAALQNKKRDPLLPISKLDSLKENEFPEFFLQEVEKALSLSNQRKRSCFAVKKYQKIFFIILLLIIIISVVIWSLLEDEASKKIIVPVKEVNTRSIVPPPSNDEKDSKNMTSKNNSKKDFKRIDPIYESPDKNRMESKVDIECVLGLKECP